MGVVRVLLRSVQGSFCVAGPRLACHNLSHLASFRLPSWPLGSAGSRPKVQGGGDGGGSAKFIYINIIILTRQESIDESQVRKCQIQTCEDELLHRDIQISNACKEIVPQTGRS